MTWHELAKLLARSVPKHKRLTKPESLRVLRTLFDAIGDSALHGNKVVIPGFGTFILRTRKARAIRHLKTKELIQLPEVRSVGFKCARGIKR